MFLDALRRRNPAFLDAVFALHQAGELPAGAYAIDLDAVERNARAISTEAARLGLHVLAMTKQVGRNPALIAACRAGGIDGCVAVDTGCARAITAAGSRLGHVGHLVQVPTAETDAIAARKPDHWTLYSLDRARQAARAARDAGREQAVYARLTMPDGVFYRTQEGGFDAHDIERTADQLDALDGLRFAGVTTFPASLYDHAARAVRPTPNLRVLVDAAERLRAAGRTVRVNGPGTTSTTTLAMLADAGVDEVEPGHGLTGMTPPHALEDLPEVPAVAYVSEISHHANGEAFAIGGGFYVDPVFPSYPVHALVGREAASAVLALAELQDPAGIDYHAMLGQPRTLTTGETAIFGFRPQIFVTRALVAPIAGVGSGAPRVEGIYAGDGNRVLWP